MIHFRIIENLVYYLKSYYCHVVFQSYSNEVVAIYNMKESCMSTINNIIELSEIIRNSVLEQTGVSISFGIGRIQENISTVQASYQEAIKALNYRLLYGNNAVIFIDNVELSEYTTNYSFTSLHEQLDNLETILSMGKVSEVIKHVEKSIGKLQNNKNIPFYYIQLIYSQFLSIVLKTCMEMSIPTENLLTDTTDLYGEIFKKQTLKELNNWFNDILYRTCEVINNRRAPKVSNIISSAMDYIYNNIHKEVSLNEVAKYVSLNPSYFSRLFKEQTGSSFVEYVKTLKIERAKLLLKQGNKKIYEICDELGYQSVQYFSSLFKLEVGVTPMEYKKNS
jgi:YesN/AraC family two-component response regulator